MKITCRAYQITPGLDESLFFALSEDACRTVHASLSVLTLDIPNTIKQFVEFFVVNTLVQHLT